MNELFSQIKEKSLFFKHLELTGVKPSMINPKLLRESPDIVQRSLEQRGCSPDIFSNLQNLDIQWRKKQQELERLQSLRNESIPKGKPSDEERAKLSELSKKLKELQQNVNDIKEELDTFSFEVPNIIQDDTPVGTDETNNIVIRQEGNIKNLILSQKHTRLLQQTFN